ncbi:hypothetical protein BYT27DRAFT_6826656 [Phlegmacium glaucopus]|nr:hypothetical protein BYT27DRAFT_6826656 [Phlegmacium glaucopus]
MIRFCRYAVVKRGKDPSESLSIIKPISCCTVLDSSTFCLSFREDPINMNRKRNHQVLGIGPLWRMRVTKAAKKRIAASDTGTIVNIGPPLSIHLTAE